MATFTLDKVSPEFNAAESPAEPQAAKLHAGPVARLMAQVSKMAGDYADYEMENGVWRKLAI